MDGQLFTWASLSAIGGASLLTYFVVQYTKMVVDRILTRTRLPTDVYAVMVAFVILVVSQLAIGAKGDDWRVYALCLANAFLVAAAAGQMHNKAIDPPGNTNSRKKQRGRELKQRIEVNRIHNDLGTFCVVILMDQRPHGWS